MTESGGRDLRALPKAHLHLHLEGAMRPATLAELCEADGRAVPDLRPAGGFGGFGAFVGLYWEACEVLRSEDRLRRLVREVVEDAAADGAVWVEPALYPVRHRTLTGGDQATLEVVLDELAAAAHRAGIGAGLIVAADRTADPAEARHLATVAARLAGRVVGFGLANDETGYPPEPFAEAFRIARDAGLLSVPHGGELAGPASVAGCLDALGADRVMHGIRAVEDPALTARLAGAGTCLDVCPSSNVALAVVGSLAEHPLPRLLEAGVAVSINADDPLLFGPGLLDEYHLCRDAFGLDDAALAAIARTSVAASGADAAGKARATAAIDAWAA